MPIYSHDLLFDWRTPKTFDRVLVAMRSSYPPERIFRDPNLNRAYRELWAARGFCLAASARRVRMTIGDAKNSDFEVMLRNGSILSIQFVEAGIPGRRRGDEYLALADQTDWQREDPEGDWAIRRAQIPHALKVCMRSKSMKGYASTVSLLVYLNISTYGEWRLAIEREMIDAARQFASTFRSVWIIWNGCLYRAWPNPSAGVTGRMFSDAPVPLGRWRDRRRTQEAFREIFD